MILVSACLLGFYARYDGKIGEQSLLIEYAANGKVLPVCPEQMGGMATPRLPAEIVGGNAEEVWTKKCEILDCQGGSVTEQFLRGAEAVGRLIEFFSVCGAVLKEGSPSCGVERVYDGFFRGVQKDGMGVTAWLLRQKGIELRTEKNLSREWLEHILKNK